MSEMTSIMVEHRDRVAVVEFAEAALMNALSLEMVDELIEALKESAATCRCMLITGRGRGFCSGAELGSVLDPEAPGYDAGAFLESHYNPLMRALRDSPIPIVTAVNGPAAGIGATIALAGDIIVASQSAYFLLSFRNIGLVPDGGSASLLLHAAGRARALEMMLLGERIAAQTALEWGMISRVVAPERLREEAFALATRLATGPTVALGMIRRLAWDAVETSYEAMLARERELQRSAGLTADHREGIAAFLAKRTARFVGQ